MKRLSFILASSVVALVVACSSSSSSGGGASSGTPADAGSDTGSSGGGGTQCTQAYKDFLLPIASVSTGAVSVVSDSGGVKTIYVDASAGGINKAPKSPRVYVNLGTASRVDVNDVDAQQDTSWDLALKRDVIFTNSGDAGIGKGGAAEVSKAFGSVSASDADGATIAPESFFDADCNRKQDPTGAVQTTFSDWYDYDQTTHIPSPKPNLTFIVAGGDGTKYKVAITSYDALPDGGTGTNYGAYLLQVSPL
jgi:hypothetical protein